MKTNTVSIVIKFGAVFVITGITSWQNPASGCLPPRKTANLPEQTVRKFCEPDPTPEILRVRRTTPSIQRKERRVPPISPPEAPPRSSKETIIPFSKPSQLGSIQVDTQIGINLLNYSPTHYILAITKEFTTTGYDLEIDRITLTNSPKGNSVGILQIPTLKVDYTEHTPGFQCPVGMAITTVTDLVLIQKSAFSMPPTLIIEEGIIRYKKGRPCTN